MKGSGEILENYVIHGFSEKLVTNRECVSRFFEDSLASTIALVGWYIAGFPSIPQLARPPKGCETEPAQARDVVKPPRDSDSQK